MEAGVVAALAYWGASTGGTTAAKVALGLAAPLVGFGFWGAVDFHQAGRLAEPLRLAQELAISGLAAAACWVAGRPAAALALAAVSAIHHALVYASGDRLVKTSRPPRPAPL